MRRPSVRPIWRLALALVVCSIVAPWGGTTLATARQARTVDAGRPGRLNPVIERLERGDRVVGTFPAGQTGLAGGRALAASGNHFVMIDLQYGVFDLSGPQQMMLGLVDKAAILRKGSLQPSVVPFARIPVAAHDAPQFVVSQLLDLGVFGIMFPDIESKDEAVSAVASMQYPQRSRSAGGPSSARGPMAAWYWGLSDADYRARAGVWPLDPEGELLAILQIETAAGVTHADEILSVPGVGAIFLGPSDLSRSMGEGSPLGPKTEDGVQTVLRACLRLKVACGYPVTARDEQTATKERARREAEGFRMLTVNVTR